MKIAIYTIALNEAKFVQSWYDSAKEADYFLIADTGSTDDTKKLALDLGITVVNIAIKPWRFDDARNASLAVIPHDIDYCIALDMDEVLLPGWRAALEEMLEQGITRPRYTYTWSWKKDGTPGLQFGGNKIHARHGYRWRHPAHEVLYSDRIPEIRGWCTLEIHHHPDETKSRSQYLSLLKLGADEDPLDSRNSYYYARELMFMKLPGESAAEFRRYLSLPRSLWKPERAAAMRYLAKVEPENARLWLISATSEDAGRRESWVALAQLDYEESNWQSCLENSLKALQIEEKPLDFNCEAFAWGEKPWDLAALAAHHLGLKEESIANGTKAIELAPWDERLRKNLTFYVA